MKRQVMLSNPTVQIAGNDCPTLSPLSWRQPFPPGGQVATMISASRSVIRNSFCLKGGPTVGGKRI
jgi:hypothetical protein